MFDTSHFKKYNIFMATKKPYLNQYFDMSFEWHRNGTTIDTATQEEQTEIQSLRAKAIKESGLTCEELSLICACRTYGITTKARQFVRVAKLLRGF